MLKLLSSELYRPLYIICTVLLIYLVIYRKCGKKTIIIPIFKNVINNIQITINSLIVYRLISIQYQMSIFYLKSNNLLTKNQYGFINGKSAELQLTKYLNCWYNN